MEQLELIETHEKLIVSVTRAVKRNMLLDIAVQRLQELDASLDLHICFEKIQLLRNGEMDFVTLRDAAEAENILRLKGFEGTRLASISLRNVVVTFCRWNLPQHRWNNRGMFLKLLQDAYEGLPGKDMNADRISALLNAFHKDPTNTFLWMSEPKRPRRKRRSPKYIEHDGCVLIADSSEPMYIPKF